MAVVCGLDSRTTSRRPRHGALSPTASGHHFPPFPRIDTRRGGHGPTSPRPGGLSPSTVVRAGGAVAVTSRCWRKARKGATPVPGPIMIIGALGRRAAAPVLQHPPPHIIHSMRGAARAADWRSGPHPSRYTPPPGPGRRAGGVWIKRLYGWEEPHRKTGHMGAFFKKNSSGTRLKKGTPVLRGMKKGAS